MVDNTSTSDLQSLEGIVEKLDVAVQEKENE
jgi:hypothetical protein